MSVICGIPTCGRCLDVMRCAKNDACLLIGPKQAAERESYNVDVFECVHCLSRVINIRPDQKTVRLTPEQLKFRAEELGEWVLEAGYDG